MEPVQYWLLASNFLMVFITFLLVLCTGALVFVTWKYAEHTKKIADLMIKDYELNILPLYEIELSNPVGLPEKLKRDIAIQNKGLINLNLRNARCDILPIAGDDFIPKNVFLYDEVEVLEKGNKKTYSIEIEGNEIPRSEPRPGTYYFGNPFYIMFSVEIAGPDLDFKTENRKLI